MNYRTAKILAEDTWEDAGTKTIPINIKDIISRITIGVRENTGQQQMAAQLMANITKIELIDGSDVLHSLNGLENQAVCIYDRRVNTMNHAGYIGDSSMYGTLGIDFGRYLHDPMLAFDPKQFRNPQLKITYDVNLARTEATSLLVEIWADVFDEKVVSPVGFLVSKEYHSRTPPASGYWYVDLPTDLLMRKLFIRGFLLKSEPWYQVSEAKLDEDNDKRIPFDWDLEDYVRTMKGVWLPIIEQMTGYCHVNDEYSKYATPTEYHISVVATPQDDGVDMSLRTIPKGGWIDLRGTSGNPYWAIVTGFVPNHTIEFPFGDPKDLDDWYDVTKVGSLRLRLLAGTGGGSGDVAVITQQLRRY
ncbi:hypothetical protein ES703_89757 [subsurface metagenome]